MREKINLNFPASVASGMAEFQRKDTESEWRILEIEDEESPDRPHIIGVEVKQSVWRSPPLASGKIQLHVYGLAGGAGDVTGEHPRFLGAFGGDFELNPDHASMYKITGGNMVLAEDLRGLRIGTYMQNEVIRWAKSQNQPGRIAHIGVVCNDALTESARDRRNRFYEQFGIAFDWNPPDNGIERASGRSVPTLTIADLRELRFVNGVKVLDAGIALRRFARRIERAEVERDRATEARMHAKRNYEHEINIVRHSARMAYCAAGIAGAVVILLSIVLGHKIA